MYARSANASAAVASPASDAAARATLPGSAALAAAAEAGLATATEAFADRAYTPEGRLVSRREPGAVLHDADDVARRMLRLVTEGVVTAVDGSDVAVRADSVCVHGDSPGAVAMARRIREVFDAEGIALTAFAPASGSGRVA